jgi:hypothetical protein
MVERLEDWRVGCHGDESSVGLFADILQLHDVVHQFVLIISLHSATNKGAHRASCLGILEDHVARQGKFSFCGVENLDDIDFALSVAVEDLLNFSQVIQKITDENQ